MNTTDKIHQARLNEWATLIAEQQASGLNIKDWCELNNVTLHKYHYWKHLLKDTLVDQVLPDIAPLPIPIQSENPISISNSQLKPYSDNKNRTTYTSCTTFQIAKISVSDITIEVDPTLPVDIICSLIKAARYA